MKLHLLGTAGYHPCDTRHTACLAIPDLGIVFDAGTGFYRVADVVEGNSLDIFLSHVHLDHCVGLTYLFDTLARRPLERVTIHAEAEKLATLEQHLFGNLLFPVMPPYEFCELSADPVPRQDNAAISHHPLKHPGGSVGFRLDLPQQSLAYITDTTATADADYLPFIEGVDVLIHECNFSDDEPELAAKTGHSCLTPVCELAKQAQVGALILTHINPLADPQAPLDMQLAAQIFPQVILAEDGMIVDF